MNISTINEAHAILWSKPFTNNGIPDAGWNCRDHAIVFAALLSISGVHVGLSSGRNMLVKGPSGKHSPVGFGQELALGSGHSWVSSSDGAIYDYSLRLPDKKKNKRWSSIPNPIIENSTCVTIKGCEISLTTKPLDYENLVNEATHIEGGLRIVYLQSKWEPFDKERISNPFAWIDSPLSNKMKDRYPEDIYLKIAMHLQDFSNGKAKSLASKSQIGAWNTVSKRDESDFDRFFELWDNRKPNKASNPSS